MSDSKARLFWASWYAHPLVSYTLHSPWWVSGTRLDGSPVICAAIEADSSYAAIDAVIDAHDTMVELEWRFVEARPEGWSPFSERFPRADWMRWPQ